MFFYYIKDYISYDKRNELKNKLIYSFLYLIPGCLFQNLYNTFCIVSNYSNNRSFG